MFPKGSGRLGGAARRNQVPRKRSERKEGKVRGTDQDSK